MIMTKGELSMLATSFNRCQGKGRLYNWRALLVVRRPQHVPSAALSNERIEAGVTEERLKTKNCLFGRAMKTGCLEIH